MDDVFIVSSPTAENSDFDADSSGFVSADVDPFNSGTWKDLSFKHHTDVYAYYKQYALKRGFGVRVNYRKPRKKFDKVDFFYLNYVCCREGTKRCKESTKNPRAEKRAECQAKFVAHYDIGGECYMIKEFCDIHSHDFVLPEHVHLLACSRHISEGQSVIINMLLTSGISIRSIYETMGRAAGGRENLGFLKSDMKNMIYTKRQRDMIPGEATILQSWLRDQARERPGFYYDLQGDINEELSSIFWADSRMIEDYKVFGDFVSFDTTYRTNNNHYPLGVFVGFNHHYGTCVFGAALLYDETGPTFEWLFQSFLKCMNGKVPLTFMTDQAGAIAVGVRSVFPDSFHGLCTFHICENARRNYKLGPSAYILEELHQMIKFVDTEKEFEFAWSRMLQKCFHERHQSEFLWLDTLYENRKKWSSAWVRNYFTAGKTTTQLSEQFNAYSRNYLKPGHSISFFFVRFQALIDDLRYKELFQEFMMRNSSPHNKFDKCPIMVHASKTYTPEMFGRIAESYDNGHHYQCFARPNLQFESTHYFDLIRSSSVDGISTIIDSCCVKMDFENLVFSCSCRMMQSWSYPCMHILRTMFIHSSLGYESCQRIPDHYINARWCRDAKSSMSFINSNVVVSASSNFGERYKVVFNLMVAVSNRVCSDQEVFDEFLQVFIAAAKKADEKLQLKSLTVRPSLEQCSTFTVAEIEDAAVTESNINAVTVEAGNDAAQSLGQSTGNAKQMKKRGNVVKSIHRLKSNNEIRRLSKKYRRKQEMSLIPTVESPPVGFE